MRKLFRKWAMRLLKSYLCVPYAQRDPEEPWMGKGLCNRTACGKSFEIFAPAGVCFDDITTIWCPNCEKENARLV